MEIRGTPKEIADFVLEVQNRQSQIDVGISTPLDAIKEAVQTAIDGMTSSEQAQH